MHSVARNRKHSYWSMLMWFLQISVTHSCCECPVQLHPKTVLDIWALGPLTNLNCRVPIPSLRWCTSFPAGILSLKKGGLWTWSAMMFRFTLVSHSSEAQVALRWVFCANKHPYSVTPSPVCRVDTRQDGSMQSYHLLMILVSDSNLSYLESWMRTC